MEYTSSRRRRFTTSVIRVGDCIVDNSFFMFVFDLKIPISAKSVRSLDVLPFLSSLIRMEAERVNTSGVLRRYNTAKDIVMNTDNTNHFQRGMHIPQRS